MVFSMSGIWVANEDEDEQSMTDDMITNPLNLINALYIINVILSLHVLVRTFISWSLKEYRGNVHVVNKGKQTSSTLRTTRRSPVPQPHSLQPDGFRLCSYRSRRCESLRRRLNNHLNSFFMNDRLQSKAIASSSKVGDASD